MHTSRCFITHIPQSKMTYLSASSIHWLPGGDSRWSSSLHVLSSFYSITADPTASNRHLMFRDRQASSRTHSAFAPQFPLQGTRNAPPQLLQVFPAISHNQCWCTRVRLGGEGYEGLPGCSEYSMI